MSWIIDEVEMSNDDMH
jgi:NAD-dependent SIR2 family protein deacetylase